MKLQNRNAIIYCRTETGGDVDLERQTHLCLTYAKRNGFSVLKTFAEQASGIEKSPALEDVVAFCANHPGTYVMTKDPARLSRRAGYGLEIIERLVKSNSLIIFVDMESM